MNIYKTELRICMKRLIFLSLVLTAVLSAGFRTGEKFPNFTLSDQFDKQITFNTKIHFILLAFEKEVSIETATFLKDQKKDFMQKKQILYISDISKIPALLASMFAVPKLKKYPFSVLLIQDDFGKQFDRQVGKLTLYKIKNGVITDMKFVRPKKLSAFLD